MKFDTDDILMCVFWLIVLAYVALLLASVVTFAVLFVINRIIKAPVSDDAQEKIARCITVMFIIIVLISFCIYK